MGKTFISHRELAKRRKFNLRASLKNFEAVIAKFEARGDVEHDVVLDLNSWKVDENVGTLEKMPPSRTGFLPLLVEPFVGPLGKVGTDVLLEADENAVNEDGEDGWDEGEEGVWNEVLENVSNQYSEELGEEDDDGETLLGDEDDVGETLLGDEDEEYGGDEEEVSENEEGGEELKIDDHDVVETREGERLSEGTEVGAENEKEENDAEDGSASVDGNDRQQPSVSSFISCDFSVYFLYSHEYCESRIFRTH